MLDRCREPGPDGGISVRSGVPDGEDREVRNDELRSRLAVAAVIAVE
jgi:hypothetical protein